MSARRSTHPLHPDTETGLIFWIFAVPFLVGFVLFPLAVLLATS